MSRSARRLLAASSIAAAAGLFGLAARPDRPELTISSLLLALLVVALSGWLVASIPVGEPLAARALDATLIGLSISVVVVLALGSAGWLSWWTLLMAAGAAGVAIALLDIRLRRASTAGSHWELGRPSLLTVVPLALAAFAVVQAVLGRILRPPVGDPLAYHLPFAVEWLQHGRLVMPIPPAGDPSPPFYPLNSSIWIYWLLSPVESEILARYVQLPFLFLLGLAAFQLARELALPARAAVAAAALAVTVPDIARGASLPENDLMLAALLVTATASLARLYRRFSTGRALMAALAIGLAIGTKVIALPFGGVLGLVWLALVVRGRGPGGWLDVGKLVAAGGLLVLAVGGYSYVRNLVVMDNPLYPSGYVVAGRTVLDGLYFPTWEWRRTHAFFPFDWLEFLFGSRRAFGLTITGWVLPGMALAAAALLRLAKGRGIERESIPALALLLWIPLTLVIFWFVIPYHFSRFLFASIVWGVVLGMWGLDRVWAQLGKGALPGWYPLLALPVIAFNLYNIPLDPAIRGRAVYWAAALVVVGAVLLGAALVPRLPRDRIPRLTAASIALVAGATVAIWPVYSEEYEARRFAEWRLQIQSFNQLTDAWEWLDRRTAGAPAVIAVAGTNEVFPLYGSGLENELVTIWRGGERASFDWGAPFALYGAPDQAAWEAQVAASGARYVVMTEDVSFGGWPVERDWMLASPRDFSRVFENADIEIWEVSERLGGAARYTVEQGWTAQFEWQAH